MATRMKDFGLDLLDPKDRLQLVQEIWDSLALDLEQAPLSESQKKEITRRITAHDSNPQAAIPWEQVESEALARLLK